MCLRYNNVVDWIQKTQKNFMNKKGKSYGQNKGRFFKNLGQSKAYA